MKKIRCITFIAAPGLLLTVLGAVLFQGTVKSVLITAGVTLLIMSAALLIYFASKKRGQNLPEYARKSSVLTRPEYDFMQLLRGIDPGRYEVIPQMALVAVIDKKTQNSYRNELFRIADFCFVDSVTFAPLLLVELNDSSHLRADRVERDRKVNEICRRAGLPLITFWTNERNDFQSIRRAVLKNILKK